jgi:hypothetical protein
MSTAERDWAVVVDHYATVAIAVAARGMDQLLTKPQSSSRAMGLSDGRLASVRG